MRLKSLLLFLTIGFYSSVLAQTSISELKTPNKSTIDFTFNSVDKTSPTFSNGTIVDKVSYELNSLQKLFPRLFKVSSCQKDSYNTLYCPDALVKADEYWGYDQSEVISKKQTVIDFEQGTYQELTSTVRDFMDGFANTHNSTVIDYQTGSGTSNVGTVIDYQNGSSVKKSGFVVDYASKVSVGEVVYADKIITSSKQITGTGYAHYVNRSGSKFNVRCNSNDRPELYTTGTAFCIERGGGGVSSSVAKNSFGCREGEYNLIDSYSYKRWWNCTEIITTATCPSGYTDNGINCKKDTTTLQ